MGPTRTVLKAELIHLGQESDKFKQQIRKTDLARCARWTGAESQLAGRLVRRLF